MEKIIELNFKKSETRLAGNPYGKAVFADQVKKMMDYSSVNVIIFPAHIEKVASSFVQGFFAEIITKIGFSGFEEVVRIETGNQELKDEILRDLYS
jgi:hypothetical protein